MEKSCFTCNHIHVCGIYERVSQVMHEVEMLMLREDDEGIYEITFKNTGCKHWEPIEEGTIL